MANRLLIKRSAVANKIPLVGDLDLGEIAVNTYDGKMYMKKNNGVDSVVQIGTGVDQLALLTDVQLTSPASNEVLTYNGTKWINNATTPAAASIVISTWTLLSGTLYYYDFTHNLGTRNVVVSLFDTTTNALVHADSIILTTDNTIRVIVKGNTFSVRLVVIANGLTVVGSGAVTSVAGRVGDVTLTSTDVGLPLKAFTYYATSLDTPNNSNWVVNAFAPAVADPSNAAFSVRRFNDTTEQGIGATVTIPVGATTMTVKMKARAQTAPAATRIVQPRIYSRRFPNNAAVGAWSAATNMTNITIPTNAFFQYSTETITLSSMGLTAGDMYQFEFTRRTTGLTGGTNLTGNWLLAELTVEFN